MDPFYNVVRTEFARNPHNRLMAEMSRWTGTPVRAFPFIQYRYLLEILRHEHSRPHRF